MSRTSTAMGRLTELAHARSRYMNRLYRRNYDQMKNEEMSQRLAMVAQNKQMKKDQFPDTFTSAGVGMQIGTSIFPGWGTAIGAAAGGLFGLFGNAIHNQSVDPSLDFGEAMGESVTRPFENGSFINNMAKIPGQLRGLGGGGGLFGGETGDFSLGSGAGAERSTELRGSMLSDNPMGQMGQMGFNAPQPIGQPSSVAAATTGLAAPGSVGQGLQQTDTGIPDAIAGWSPNPRRGR